MAKNSISTTNRRAFLRDGTLILIASGATLPALAGDSTPGKRKVRVGLVTDLHYADKPAAGSRYYQESLTKLAEAGEKYLANPPDLMVELGDLIDAADSVEVEKGYLRRINRDFAQLPGDKHYVLGNHCVYTLKKEEFLEGVEQERSYYSFDKNGIHFIVLDACFRSNGDPYGRKNFVWTDPNIPDAEVEWLQANLQQHKRPTVVFVHQRLDVSNHYGIKNAPAIRKLLEESGNVLAVLQGHSHKNEHHEINGVHYCVLAAMVEGSGKANNSYAAMEIDENHNLRIEGFRRQTAYDWK